MKNIIKKQLDLVKSVKIDYNEDTQRINIPKTIEIINDALNKGEVYIIELDDKLLNPSSNSMLASNWNSGKIPTSKVYKVELLDIVNNMYKFNGIAYKDGQDIYSDNWYGWFPKDNFKVIEKVEAM